ncbi:hypothetical protein [Stenotrophomonas indicatrix]|uniref:hypothetical protein n=1 Tax=Stenotrophomonas indicatrix TaxID=2045451 RepID=UPI0008CE4F19|nr:hypothetical protein [Stenotrophomonas indicatrix]SES73978.1 hypothetical protein SAMN05720615_101279 [Stenotrophomonas indicatrix]
MAWIYQGVPNECPPRIDCDAAGEIHGMRGWVMDATVDPRHAWMGPYRSRFTGHRVVRTKENPLPAQRVSGPVACVLSPGMARR